MNNQYFFLPPFTHVWSDAIAGFPGDNLLSAVLDACSLLSLLQLHWTQL